MGDMTEHDARLDERMRLAGITWSLAHADLRAGNLDHTDRVRFADRLIEIAALLHHYPRDPVVPPSEIGDWLLKQIEACERAARIAPRHRRRILLLTQALRGILHEHHLPDDSDPRCATCTEVDADGERRWPCNTLRFAASIFVDRPGFNMEWLPFWTAT